MIWMGGKFRCLNQSQKGGWNAAILNCRLGWYTDYQIVSPNLLSVLWPQRKICKHRFPPPNICTSDCLDQGISRPPATRTVESSKPTCSLSIAYTLGGKEGQLQLDEWVLHVCAVSCWVPQEQQDKSFPNRIDRVKRWWGSTWLGRIVLIPARPLLPCDLGQVISPFWASVSSYLKEEGRVWCWQQLLPALICYNSIWFMPAFYNFLLWIKGKAFKQLNNLRHFIPR